MTYPIHKISSKREAHILNLQLIAMCKDVLLGSDTGAAAFFLGVACGTAWHVWGACVRCGQVGLAGAVCVIPCKDASGRSSPICALGDTGFVSDIVQPCGWSLCVTTH